MMARFNRGTGGKDDDQAVADGRVYGERSVGLRRVGDAGLIEKLLRRANGRHAKMQCGETKQATPARTDRSRQERTAPVSGWAYSYFRWPSGMSGGWRSAVRPGQKIVRRRRTLRQTVLGRRRC